MLALRFYDVVLSLHVAAIVIAFGVVFTYPLVLPWLRQHHPGAMVVAPETQARIDRHVISPAATALLAAPTSPPTRGLWSEVWVTIEVVILIAILGFGGAVIAPTERRLEELAACGVDSPEYDAAFRRMMTLTSAVAGLVLVPIFLMVTKLGA